MAGAGLIYDLSGIAMLRRRVADIGDLDRRRLFDVIGATVESQTRRRIEEDKTDPEGNAWPDWSEGYAKTRHGNHSQLEGEGLLLASMGYAISLAGDHVEIGSNMIYAATHQFGDLEDRNIPARAYLGLSADDEADLESVVDDFLRRVAP